MAIKEIPKKIEYGCDCCGTTEVLNAPVKGDHSVIGTIPKNWMTLHMECNGPLLSYPRDPVRKILCDSCGERTIRAIEQVEPAVKERQT